MEHIGRNLADLPGTGSSNMHPPSNACFLGPSLVSDIIVFVLKRDVKLQPTNLQPSRVLISNGILIASAVFLHSSRLTISILYNWPPPLPPSKLPNHRGSESHLMHGSLANQSPQSKRYLNRFSQFCRAHDRDKLTDIPCYTL